MRLLVCVTSNAPRRRFCSDFHLAARWYKLFTFFVKLSASSSTLRCAEIAFSSLVASNWSCAVCSALSAFAIAAFACAAQNTYKYTQSVSTIPSQVHILNKDIDRRHTGVVMVLREPRFAVVDAHHVNIQHGLPECSHLSIPLCTFSNNQTHNRPMPAERGS
jgi:hypothetical protein